VNFKGPHTDALLKTAVASFKQGAAACSELFKPKGLAEHIVGAIVEKSYDRLSTGTSG
jgi:hypothetical protein